MLNPNSDKPLNEFMNIISNYINQIAATENDIPSQLIIEGSHNTIFNLCSQLTEIIRMCNSINTIVIQPSTLACNN